MIGALVVILSFALVLFILFPLRGVADQTLKLVKEMVQLFEGVPGSLQALSDDLSAQTRNQGAVLNDVLARLEKAADRAMFAARQLAGDLAAREEKTDTALAGVAEDLHARWEAVDAASAGVAEDLAERQRIIDKLNTGVALNLTERERLIDLASAGLATDLTAREEKVDAASTSVADDLAASIQRATETLGSGAEPGAAADAALTLPPEDDG